MPVRCHGKQQWNIGFENSCSSIIAKKWVFSCKANIWGQQDFIRIFTSELALIFTSRSFGVNFIQKYIIWLDMSWFSPVIVMKLRHSLKLVFGNRWAVFVALVTLQAEVQPSEAMGLSARLFLLPRAMPTRRQCFFYLGLCMASSHTAIATSLPQVARPRQQRDATYTDARTWSCFCLSVWGPFL